LAPARRRSRRDHVARRLCLFAGWTALLVTSLALFRGLFASRAGKALNSFNPDGTDVGGLGQRLTRAVVQIAIVASWIFRLVF
jgi:hypothetical protein